MSLTKLFFSFSFLTIFWFNPSAYGQEIATGPSIELLAPSKKIPGDFDPTFGASYGGMLAFDAIPLAFSVNFGATPFATDNDTEGFTFKYSGFVYYIHGGAHYYIDGFYAGVEMGTHHFELAFNDELNDRYSDTGFSYAPIVGYFVAGLNVSLRYQWVEHQATYFALRFGVDLM